jgi:hypothetical protein
MSSNSTDQKPWPNIIVGILMLLVALGLYIYFSNIENEGGRYKMQLLVLMLYKILGKTGTAIVFVAVGIYYIRKGVLALVHSDD